MNVSLPMVFEGDSCMVSVYDPLPGAGTAQHMPRTRRVRVPARARPTGRVLTAVGASGSGGEPGARDASGCETGGERQALGGPREMVMKRGVEARDVRQLREASAKRIDQQQLLG